MPAIGSTQRHYGGKMANLDIEVSGNLFNPFAAKRAMEAANREIKQMTEEAAAVARDALSAGAGVRSGDYRASITGELKKDLLGIAYSKETKPIKTWIDRGTRRGQKLWAGTRNWVKSKAAVRRMDPAGRIQEAIMKVLE